MLTGLPYVQGKMKVVCHVFVKCNEAVRVWNTLGLPTSIHANDNSVIEWFFGYVNVLSGDMLSKFVMVCWGIWCNRNENVWKGLSFDL